MNIFSGKGDGSGYGDGHRLAENRILSSAL